MVHAGVGAWQGQLGGAVAEAVVHEVVVHGGTGHRPALVLHVPVHVQRRSRGPERQRLPRLGDPVKAPPAADPLLRHLQVRTGR